MQSSPDPTATVYDIVQDARTPVDIVAKAPWEANTVFARDGYICAFLKGNRQEELETSCHGFNRLVKALDELGIVWDYIDAPKAFVLLVKSERIPEEYQASFINAAREEREI